MWEKETYEGSVWTGYGLVAALVWSSSPLASDVLRMVPRLAWALSTSETQEIFLCCPVLLELSEPWKAFCLSALQPAVGLSFRAFPQISVPCLGKATVLHLVETLAPLKGFLSLLSYPQSTAGRVVGEDPACLKGNSLGSILPFAFGLLPVYLRKMSMKALACRWADTCSMTGAVGMLICHTSSHVPVKCCYTLGWYFFTRVYDRFLSYLSLQR